MPIYSYKCKKCNRKFQLTMTISQHDSGKIKCPSCNSKSVAQTITPFFTKTSKKS